MKRLSSNSTFKAVAACAFALMVAGCAGTSTTSSPSPSTTPSTAPAATDQPAPAPSTPPPAVAPAPSGDVGTVVFFRDSKFVGSMVGFKVREGEQELGKLSNGSYFTVQLPAGAHAFTVHSEAKDVLNLEIERGETYYVQGSISMGVMVGRPNLAPSDVAAFTAVKDKLKNSAEPPKAKKRNS
jgi:hypothetical protein